MSTYDLPDNILKIYKSNREVIMKEKIMKLLKKYGENKSNLESESLREMLADDILKTFKKEKDFREL